MIVFSMLIVGGRKWRGEKADLPLVFTTQDEHLIPLEELLTRLGTDPTSVNDLDFWCI